MTRRILLIGATGMFGEKLASLLAKSEDIELILTSRDAERARALARRLSSVASRATISGIALDYRAGAAEAIGSIAPFLVIDASGPFQGRDFALARATLEAGAHWIDLADARDYILKFSEALDVLARKSGVSAVTGASSTPALSAAAVRELTSGWQRIDTIDMAILPGGSDRAGRSVIEAVLSFAGKPLGVWQNGQPRTVCGWGTLRRERFAGLGVRYLSPVETVDAAIMPDLFHISSRVSFSAGLESRLEHFGLWLLAKMKQRSFISKLLPVAPWLQKGRALTRLWSSGKGGMSVRCAGIDGEGLQRTSEWRLASRHGKGAYVPVLPALAMTRKLLAGALKTGARPASDEIALESIEAEMQSQMLEVSRSTERASREGLFESALGGADYARLPNALREFHDPAGYPVWSGRADVDAGTNVLARLSRWVFGFPPSGRNVLVSVTVDRRGKKETWSRDFAGARFASTLAPSTQGQVAETFLPFKIHMKLEASNGEIRMPVTGWQIGRLPLPLFLAPRSDTREYADQSGRFCFDVRISVPIAGLIAHYRGWLQPRREK